MSDQHSPTPWEIHADEGLCEYDVHDARGDYIFSLPMNVDDGDEIDPVDEANASLVLQAVNAHRTLTAERDRLAADRGRLLAALVELHKLIDFDEPTDGEMVFQHPDAINAAMKQARDAFRLAEQQ